MPLVSKPITPRSQPDKALNRVLERLREERGLSREMLAHEAGLTASAYHRIVSAKAAPGWSSVRKIAEALGVSMGELGKLVDEEEA